MEIAHKLAGYSLGKAYDMCRAIGKREEKQIEEDRKNFIYGSDDGKIAGCIKNGTDGKNAASIFDDILNFAAFAFNKAHAIAYAFLAYQSAYLKTFYNEEYMKLGAQPFTDPYLTENRVSNT